MTERPTPLTIKCLTKHSWLGGPLLVILTLGAGIALLTYHYTHSGIDPRALKQGPTTWMIIVGCILTTLGGCGTLIPLGMLCVLWADTDDEASKRRAQRRLPFIIGTVVMIGLTAGILMIHFAVQSRNEFQRQQGWRYYPPNPPGKAPPPRPPLPPPSPAMAPTAPCGYFHPDLPLTWKYRECNLDLVDKADGKADGKLEWGRALRMNLFLWGGLLTCGCGCMFLMGSCGLAMVICDYCTNTAAPGSRKSVSMRVRSAKVVQRALSNGFSAAKPRHSASIKTAIRRLSTGGSSSALPVVTATALPATIDVEATSQQDADKPVVDAEKKVREVMLGMEEERKAAVVRNDWATLTWDERFERLQASGHIAHDTKLADTSAGKGVSPPAVVTVQLDHVEPGMGRQPPVDAETKVRQVMKAMDERSKQTVVAVLGPYKHLTPWGNLTWHERFERLQGFGHISHELAAIPNDEEAEEAVQKAMTAIDDETKARLMSRVGWDAFSAAERWTCLYMEWLIIPDPPPMLQAFGHQRSQESEEEMPDRYCYDCDDCTSCCKSWYEDIDRTEVVASLLGWLICSLAVLPFLAGFIGLWWCAWNCGVPEKLSPPPPGSPPFPPGMYAPPLPPLPPVLPEAEAILLQEAQGYTPTEWWRYVLAYCGYAGTGASAFALLIVLAAAVCDLD